MAHSTLLHAIQRLCRIHLILSVQSKYILIRSASVSVLCTILVPTVENLNHSAHHTNIGAIGSRRPCFNTTPSSQMCIFTEAYCTILTKYYSGNQIKKQEMGGTCGMYRKQKRCIQGFGRKTT